MLSIRRLNAYYGDFQALFAVDLEVTAGEIVAIVGANGAGKSTLLKSIVGLVPVRRETIVFDGAPIGGRAPNDVVRMGIALVPEGRRLFPSLTVEENLRAGAFARRAGRWGLDSVYELFPALRERAHLPSLALSGGEQQMAAIGRALMSNPRLLLCDEVSLGLAPIVVRAIYASLKAALAEGLTVIVVEQDVGLAQRVADRIILLRKGEVTLAGHATALSRAEISRAYFGVEA